MLPARNDLQLKAEMHVEIRNCIKGFLGHCQIDYHQYDSTDKTFLALCYEEANSRGYILEGEQSLLPFIPGGAIMALTGYAHLQDIRVQILIALYTACGIYLDDKFKQDIDAVASFGENFLHATPHKDRVLDAFSDIILEIFRCFPRVAANIMVSSTLNGVNALLLEYETRDMKISKHAGHYPTFSRVMSGASETYALFAFPATVPVEDYIQALPELMIFINNGNDILSFFKEESDGESTNRISLLAASSGLSKIQVLHDLVNEAAIANDNVLEILKHSHAAYNAYRKFSCGFIGFHLALKRYRLVELDL
ncbi:hypothetical protein D9757_009757 [Collybiopsis confluens]|uniref:Terpenoid synthase n=1 Tax=Collybiopsis confluens TaxID=2823264 RepID=A0A8H5LXQ5_9AGAR|nr:hypothetical protein D9757_009757 [Collybiopsis confluens]